MNLRLRDRICRGCHQVLRISLFQRKNAGHDLRCTCHRTDHICILPKQYPAAVRIHQHRRSGIKFCRFIPEHPLRILCSSIVFSYVNWQNLWVRVAMHLLLLIPVVGVTYEFNRFVGRHDNAVTRILSAPGMWLQNFTTFEPDDSMIECAIRALELVIPEQKGSDAW